MCRVTTTSTQSPALWRMYLEIILSPMCVRKTNGCNDATVSLVSVLGPVWPCLIVLERLRRQQLARPVCQVPPAGSDCLRRLPRLLQETVAPMADSPAPRAAGAPPGTAAARAVGSHLGRFAAALQRKRREATRVRAGQLGWERSIAN